MGMIASALYLVSPLAVAGHPTFEPLRPYAYETAAISVDFTTSNEKPRRTYIVFDAPVISRQRRPHLDEIVRDEIAENIRKHPNGNASAGLMAPVDDATTVAIGTFDDAVVANHEERVAALTQRLKALQAITSQPAAIRELSGRLRRAVAAQKLAVARVAVASMNQDSCDVLGNVRCKLNTQELALRVKPTLGSQVMQKRRQTLAAISLQAPTNGTRMARSAPVEASELRLTGKRYATSSSHARRLLDVARHRISDLPQERSGPEIQIAGLLSFPGSDTWSLPDQTARA